MTDLIISGGRFDNNDRPPFSAGGDLIIRLRIIFIVFIISIFASCSGVVSFGSSGDNYPIQLDDDDFGTNDDIGNNDYELPVIPGDEDSDLPLDKLSSCSEGPITADCKCGNMGKKSGFCCSDLWFDSQYFSCPSGIRYYVAPDGNDTNSGLSEYTPFKTFYKPITLAKPGDVILALSGTYNEENSVRHSAAYHIENPLIMLPICEEVSNGSEDQPITIRGLSDSDGKHPILEFMPTDATGATDGRINAYISGRSFWVIDGFDFHRSGIWIWGGNKDRDGNSHDIRIQRSRVHDLVVEGGGNPGLIKIDRADSGGAYNITIKENHLYDLSDVESPGIWRDSDGAVDSQHLGAVTLMSMCDYIYTEQYFNGNGLPLKDLYLDKHP